MKRRILLARENGRNGIGRRDFVFSEERLPRHLAGRLKKEACSSVGESAESFAGATLFGVLVGATGVRAICALWNRDRLILL